MSLVAIARSKRALDFAFSFGSSFGARSLNFVGFAIIANALSTTDYAHFAILIALVATITDLTTAGLNNSLVRYVAKFSGEKNYTKLNALVSTSTINALIISAIITIGIAALSKSFSQTFLQDQHQGLLVLSSIAVLGTLLFGVFASTFQGLQDFKSSSAGNIAFSAAKVSLLAISIAYFPPSILSCIIVFTVTPFLILPFFAWRLVKQGIKPTRYDKTVMHETIHFGKWMVLWAIVSVAQSRLDVYLLSPLSTPEQVAYFDVAQKFSGIVMMAIASYGTILNPKLASNSNPIFLKREFNKSLIISTFVSLGLVASAFFLPAALDAIFSYKYHSSATPLRILLIGLIPYSFTLATNSLLFAWGKSYVFFVAALIGLLVNISASWLLIPTLGAIGSSVSIAIVNTSGLIVSVIAYLFHSRKFNTSHA